MDDHNFSIFANQPYLPRTPSPDIYTDFPAIAEDDNYYKKSNKINNSLVNYLFFCKF